jgi:hypothetical protein
MVRILTGSRTRCELDALPETAAEETLDRSRRGDRAGSRGPRNRGTTADGAGQRATAAVGR